MEKVVFLLRLSTCVVEWGERIEATHSWLLSTGVRKETFLEIGERRRKQPYSLKCEDRGG